MWLELFGKPPSETKLSGESREILEKSLVFNSRPEVVRAINKYPISSRVPYHSVMGDRGKGDTPDSSDGIVAYWSSHLDGAVSEKVVPSHHGSHQIPEGIEEGRRILREHAGLR